jgi:hypothetical protein
MHYYKLQFGNKNEYKKEFCKDFRKVFSRIVPSTRLQIHGIMNLEG